jgi:hypothetical protein
MAIINARIDDADNEPMVGALVKTDIPVSN